MRERKRLEKDKIDKRLIYPIDELRVKFWLSQIKQVSGYKTEYALAKAFDGDDGTQAKWKNYTRGGQPNEDVLTKVENKLSGSRDWYICGPDESKLWVALAHDTTIEKLMLIAKVSSGIDRKIAQFRIDALNCEVISREGAYPNIIFDAFNLRVSEIRNDFDKLMNNQLVHEAITILETLIQPQIDDLCEKCNDDLMDYIMDSRYKKSDYIKMQRESEYEELKLATVLKKGKREADS